MKNKPDGLFFNRQFCAEAQNCCDHRGEITCVISPRGLSVSLWHEVNMKQTDYLDTKGRIFDIQRYSIHDGTGVRTIVFLKGCVLRCRWCCNPESQEYEIQTMMVAGKPKIIGQDVTVREVMETVVRDRTYYRRSGGGLTLSGGESLCQPEFAAALLRAAKENGINTAMESMACVPMETIEKILEWLDVYLCDVKHMNGEKHKEFTGRDNALMLSNIQKIAESGKDAARHPGSRDPHL